jgi:hypothetical protein
MDIEEYNAIRPSYYNDSEISCIDAMVSAFGREATAHFCKVNAFKYIWRLGNKDNESQEIGKIKWYLDKYLELTQLPIGLRLDTGEPICESGVAISQEAPTELYGKPELLKKGLTDREAENILDK